MKEGMVTVEPALTTFLQHRRQVRKIGNVFSDRMEGKLKY